MLRSVREKQTSALEVTIPESDLENTEKLEALQKIASANRGQNDLILRLMSPRYGEVIARVRSEIQCSIYSRKLLSRWRNCSVKIVSNRAIARYAGIRAAFHSMDFV